MGAAVAAAVSVSGVGGCSAVGVGHLHPPLLPLPHRPAEDSRRTIAGRRPAKPGPDTLHSPASAEKFHGLGRSPAMAAVAAAATTSPAMGRTRQSEEEKERNTKK